MLWPYLRDKDYQRCMRSVALGSSGPTEPAACPLLGPWGRDFGNEQESSAGALHARGRGRSRCRATGTGDVAIWQGLSRRNTWLSAAPTALPVMPKGRDD